MDFNDVKSRIQRVYASIAQLKSDDYEKKIKWTPEEFDIRFGSTDDPDDEHKVLSIISALADLKDNLKNRMDSLGLRKQLVEDEINKSLPLQLITDLDNQNKHDYPLKLTKRSNRDPQIKNVASGLEVTFGPTGDGGIMFHMDSATVSFDGGAGGKHSIDAEITDGSGNFICSLDSMVNDAIMLWEQFITTHKLT
jgi:hypothetical protein